MQLNHSVC